MFLLTTFLVEKINNLRSIVIPSITIYFYYSYLSIRYIDILLLIRACARICACFVIPLVSLANIFRIWRLKGALARAPIVAYPYNQQPCQTPAGGGKMGRETSAFPKTGAAQHPSLSCRSERIATTTTTFLAFSDKSPFPGLYLNHISFGTLACTKTVI